MAQPLRMQGQYWDGEIDLCYNRYRYFDPKIGAFISKDPLGLAAGENVYAYAPNVWGWVDPLGLSCEHSLVRSSLPGLPDTFAREFEGDVRARTFKAGDKVYRSPWIPDETPDNPGSWFGTRRTSTQKGTDSMFQIEKWDNPNQVVRSYEFKQDVTVYYGKVKGGTGYQILVPKDITPGEILKFAGEAPLK